MQFLVERDVFMERLTTLNSIIEPKNDVPILRNILIDAGATSLLLSATDNDMQLAMPCPAEVTRPGQVTVSGPLTHELVRKCHKGGQIGVALGGASKRRKSSDDAERLTFTSGKAEFTLYTLPADDWPQIHVRPDAAIFSLECRQLRALIEKTHFAISNDQTRYYLGGIYLHVLDETLAAVATDGHRLAVKTVPLPAGADDMPSPPGEHENPGPRAAGDGVAAMRGAIIPKDAAAAALKILPDSEVECELAVGANLMRLRVGEVELITRLIDGAYPDWQRVVPTGGAGRMIAPREALAKAVARVGVVLDKRDQAMRMRFEAETLKLSARSVAEGHEAREHVEGCVYEGGIVELGLNPGYLAEILETMDGGQLAIVLQGDAASSILFEEVDGDGSLRMVLMPMRLDGAGAMPRQPRGKKRHELSRTCRRGPCNTCRQRPMNECPRRQTRFREFGDERNLTIQNGHGARINSPRIRRFSNAQPQRFLRRVGRT